MRKEPEHSEEMKRRATERRNQEEEGENKLNSNWQRDEETWSDTEKVLEGRIRETEKLTKTARDRHKLQSY